MHATVNRIPTPWFGSNSESLSQAQPPKVGPQDRHRLPHATPRKLEPSAPPMAPFAGNVWPKGMKNNPCPMNPQTNKEAGQMVCTAEEFFSYHHLAIENIPTMCKDSKFFVQEHQHLHILGPRGPRPYKKRCPLNPRRQKRAKWNTKATKKHQAKPIRPAPTISHHFVPAPSYASELRMAPAESNPVPPKQACKKRQRDNACMGGEKNNQLKTSSHLQKYNKFKPLASSLSFFHITHKMSTMAEPCTLRVPSSTAFLSSTPVGLLPVSHIDDRPFQFSQPNSVFTRLMEKWETLTGVNPARQILDA